MRTPIEKITCELNHLQKALEEQQREKIKIEESIEKLKNIIPKYENTQYILEMEQGGEK